MVGGMWPSSRRTLRAVQIEKEDKKPFADTAKQSLDKT
jgi:hypothetical protein